MYSFFFWWIYQVLAMNWLMIFFNSFFLMYLHSLIFSFENKLILLKM